jgi:hypothetical protein
VTRHYRTKKERLKEEELERKHREYCEFRARVKQQLLSILEELEKSEKE